MTLFGATTVMQITVQTGFLITVLDLVGEPWYEIDINFECATAGPSGPYNQWAGGSGDGSGCKR